MATPTRFTSGISTYSPRSTFSNYPVVPAPNQSVVVNEFLPYVAANFTLAGAGQTLTSANYGGGALSVALASTATNNATLILNGNASGNGQALQALPGNAFWFSTQVAVPAASRTGTGSAVIYGGLFNAAPGVAAASASDGFWFVKPTNSSAVNFVIKKGGQTTTFTNVADLAQPDGIYGSSASAGTLTTGGAGNVYTSIAVNAAGSGYAVSPLVLATGASGSGAVLNCGLGSGSLYAPIISNAGSSYSTYVNEVIPWVELSVYFDGKDALTVGVNGKNVLSISSKGVNSVTGGAGNSYAVNTLGGSFMSATTLSTSLCPVTPIAGSGIHLLPQTPLFPVLGVYNDGTNALANTVYFDSLRLGVEYN